jgi:hypothetical protein
LKHKVGGIKLIMSDLLHITVGAAPRSDFNLTHELRLLKAGLLYADKVRLCSLSSAVAVTLPYLSVLPDKEILELTLQAAKALNQSPESMQIFIDKYKQLQKRNSVPVKNSSYFKISSSNLIRLGKN